MEVVILSIFLLPQVAFSIYLITQTSSEGIPTAARSSRMVAIVVGFLPCLLVPLLAQLYFYSKYRNGSSVVHVAALPTNFGGSRSTSPPATPSDQPPIRPSPSQQNDNPFL